MMLFLVVRTESSKIIVFMAHFLLGKLHYSYKFTIIKVATNNSDHNNNSNNNVLADGHSQLTLCCWTVLFRIYNIGVQKKKKKQMALRKARDHEPSSSHT